MPLSKEDAEIFYELWFPLLDFVNKKFNGNPYMGKCCLTRKTQKFDKQNAKTSRRKVRFRRLKFYKNSFVKPNFQQRG